MREIHPDPGPRNPRGPMPSPVEQLQRVVNDLTDAKDRLERELATARARITELEAQLKGEGR